MDHSRTIAGGDFIEIVVGFFSYFLDGFLARCRMFFDKGADSITGQNRLFQLFTGFYDRTGNTLAVSIVLQQQLPPEVKGLVTDVRIRIRSLAEPLA